MATLPACTYAVVSESQPAHCVVVGDCAAGFACNVATHQCDAVADADSPPLPGVPIDAKGGDVLGDGLSVHFEPGAVGEVVQVDVEKASATNVAVNINTQSGFFAVAPDITLAGRVVITIVASGCGAGSGCNVFERPANFGDPWIKLANGNTTSGKATGVLDTNDVLSGVYVAGTGP